MHNFSPISSHFLSRPVFFVVLDDPKYNSFLRIILGEVMPTWWHLFSPLLATVFLSFVFWQLCKRLFGRALSVQRLGVVGTAACEANQEADSHNCCWLGSVIPGSPSWSWICLLLQVEMSKIHIWISVIEIFKKLFLWLLFKIYFVYNLLLIGLGLWVGGVYVSLSDVIAFPVFYK